MSFLTRAALAALCLAPVAAAAQSVIIENRTSYNMVGFTSTNSGAKNWGRNVLYAEPLYAGNYMSLNFGNKHGYCLFDFKATFADGSVLQAKKVNVCTTGTWTYTD